MSRKVRGFLCYAHADGRPVERLRALLGQRLAIARGLEISVWWDDHILLGQPWDDEIRAAIAAADFGLLAVSPALLGSSYIRRVEVAALTASPGPAVMPVGLHRVDSERSDLAGLDAGRIFRCRRPGRGGSGEPSWFSELAGENRERFCDALAAEIVDRLLADRP